MVTRKNTLGLVGPLWDSQGPPRDSLGAPKRGPRDRRFARTARHALPFWVDLHMPRGSRDRRFARTARHACGGGPVTGGSPEPPVTPGRFGWIRTCRGDPVTGGSPEPPVTPCRFRWIRTCRGDPVTGGSPEPPVTPCRFVWIRIACRRFARTPCNALPFGVALQ